MSELSATEKQALVTSFTEVDGIVQKAEKSLEKAKLKRSEVLAEMVKAFGEKATVSFGGQQFTIVGRRAKGSAKDAPPVYSIRRPSDKPVISLD